jgi:light-regulated signal transduction histidine kinase (bacteriophytochrome)
MSFQRLDMDEVVSHAMENLQVRIEQAEAEIEVANPLPRIWGDHVQMIQLMQNLLDNAVKFSTRQPRVRIRGACENGETVIDVCDNGIGMAEEHIQRAFRIFQRLNRPEEYSGTGIGLAVCKRIMERHGGHIEVESQPGEGTTFRLHFPTKPGARL